MPSSCRRLTAVFGTILLALTACAASYTAPAVPPLVAERVPAPPPAPVPLIWQPGHYIWDGAQYRWSPGRWVDRAGHGTLWQDGYWQRHGRRYEWVPGHWM
ncbi:MAG: YXWGXW repeat-containing protein [Acetobacteraceae bacterium]|nr:YXWGXW repeat-containing protein [Acetobacteraceae bacterium]